MANKTTFTALKTAPVEFIKKLHTIRENSEIKRPEENSLGNVARTIIAAFFWSRTLKIVGDTIAEKNNNIPSRIEFSTKTIKIIFLFMRFMY